MNNMTSRNLSVCVAQNLLWPPRRSGASEMLIDVSKVSQVCDRLIESTAEVFGPQCLELFAAQSAAEDVATTLNVTTDDDELCDNVGVLLSLFNPTLILPSFTSQRRQLSRG